MNKKKLNNDQNSKLSIVLRDSLNCLIKGSKCKYKISYILMFFLPIMFLILGYIMFFIKIFKILFRKWV